MKKLLFFLILFSCMSVCYAQKSNSDPLYTNTKSVKKQNKEKWKKAHPLVIKQELIIAGSATIGVGLGVIGLSNAIISSKIKNENDPSKVNKLQKNQRLFNYIGGGMGIIGSILCITSIRRDYSGGYAITKKLSFSDKNRQLSLVYRF